jgi:hypothetical protein
MSDLDTVIYKNAQALYQALKAITNLIGDDDLPDNGELSGAAVCDLARAVIERIDNSDTIFVLSREDVIGCQRDGHTSGGDNR